MTNLTILLVTSAISGFIGIWEWFVLAEKEAGLWFSATKRDTFKGRAARTTVVVLVMRYTFLLWSIVFAVIAFKTDFHSDSACKAAGVWFLIALVILNGCRNWMLAARADSIIKSVLPTSPNLRAWRIPLSWGIWSTAFLATVAVYATLVWSYAYRNQWTPTAYQGRCISMKPPVGDVDISQNVMFYTYILGVLFDLVCLASVLIGLDSLGRQSSNFQRFIAIFGRHSVVSYFLITALQCFVLGTLIRGEIVYESVTFGIQTAIIIRMIMSELAEFGPFASSGAKQPRNFVVAGMEEAKGACTCGANGSTGGGARRGSATVLARLGMEPPPPGSIGNAMKGGGAAAGGVYAWGTDSKEPRLSSTGQRASLSGTAPRLSLPGGLNGGAIGVAAAGVARPQPARQTSSHMEQLRSYHELDKFSFADANARPTTTSTVLSRFDSRTGRPSSSSTMGSAATKSFISPLHSGEESPLGTGERFEIDQRTGSGLAWRPVSRTPSLEKEEELREHHDSPLQTGTPPAWATAWASSLSSERPTTSSTTEAPLSPAGPPPEASPYAQPQTALRVSMEQDLGER